MTKQPLIKQGWLRVLIFMIAYLLVTGLLYFAVGKLLPAPVAPPGSMAGQTILNDSYVLTGLLFSFAVSVAMVYLFRTRVDKLPFGSLGFTVLNHKSYAATGFFTGLLLLGLGTLLLVAGKHLQWAGITFNATDLFLSMGLMALAAFAEEVVMRGYVLNNLLQSMNRWAALTLSALLFALLHLNNPGITPVALLNIFLGGLLLGVNYIFTRNLWYGLCLHFSWNFYQGAILGYRVSGLNLPGVLQQDISGNPLITGGNFGFEGSLWYTLLSTITVAALAWVYRKNFITKAGL